MEMLFFPQFSNIQPIFFSIFPSTTYVEIDADSDDIMKPVKPNC